MYNKKKIIVNATCVGKNPTGVGVFTRELVSNLVRLRPDLFYIFALFDFFDGFENRKIISEFLSPEYGSKGHLSRILWAQTMLAVEYKRKRGSLLLSTLPEAPILIKNKIVVVHDIIPVKFPEIQPRMKYYYFYVLPIILKTSRHLVFDSENTRRDVFEYYNLKNVAHSVIHAGYDHNLFYPVEGGLIRRKYGYDRYFIYVGDMRPYKNLENAIRSFARADLGDVLFIAAGKQDKRYFPAIERIVKEHHLEGRVFFPDYIPLEDLPHFYRDSIALFFPSRYEGFGLPPLEAMATGAPVITTRMASIPEVCGDAALYVDPDDIDDMASALRSLAMNKSLREYHSRASLQRASMFGWDKTSKEYLDLLLSLLDEK